MAQLALILRGNFFVMVAYLCTILRCYFLEASLTLLVCSSLVKVNSNTRNLLKLHAIARWVVGIYDHGD